MAERAIMSRIFSPAGLEVVFALFIALTAAGSTWSAYQSARWSGVQAANFARANTQHSRATQLTTVSEAARTIDEDLFVQWLAANAEDKPAQQQALRMHFSGRLETAFAAWLAAGAPGDATAPKSPFDMDAYIAEGADQITRQTAEADERFAAAEDANQQSDDYVLVTVAFALLIVINAVGSKFPSPYIQRAAALFGGAGLLAGCIVLATFPVH